MGKSTRGPARAAMDRVLADGEWHHLEELYDAGAKAVPFPVAVRAWEREMGTRRERAGTANPQSVSVDQKVTVGARRMARDTLRLAVRLGALERIDDRVRLRPEPEEQA